MLLERHARSRYSAWLRLTTELQFGSSVMFGWPTASLFQRQGAAIGVPSWYSPFWGKNLMGLSRTMIWNHVASGVPPVRGWDPVVEVDLRSVKLSPFAVTTRDMLAGRLAHLEQLGLATPASAPSRPSRHPQRTWRFVPDFQAKLSELGDRNDIIKQLYATLGNRASRVTPQIQRVTVGADQDARAPASVRGVLIAKGALDEMSDERFVVVEDGHGRPHYARVWTDKGIEAVQLGGVIEIGRGAHRRQAMTEEVIAVARVHKALQYSTGAHRQWMREQRPGLRPDQVERRLRRVSKSVARLVRQEGSGITRATENAVKVDPHLLERFTARRLRWLDVRVLAVHSLESQVTTEAYTWIDRQIIRQRISEKLPANDITQLASVQNAMQRRSDWLVENGFAEGDPNSAKEGGVRFTHGAIERLRNTRNSRTNVTIAMPRVFLSCGHTRLRRACTAASNTCIGVRLQ